jgi:DNA-binding CsgD family transcriptional regulator/tetratricopeptide (TPR) repeat protein
MADVVAAASSLIAAVNGRRGVGLFVVGAAGSGKTAALNEIIEAAQEASLRVVTARGASLEQEWPLALARQLLGSGDAPASTNRHDGPLTVQGVADRLERLFSLPTLLAIDDLHWADPESLLVLSYVCRRIAARPVAVTATLRPWPERAPDVAFDLEREGKAAVMNLDPLSLEDWSRVVAESGAALSHEITSSLWRRCAGNPLALSDVTAALARGTVSSDGEPSIRLSETTIRSFLAGLSSETVRCAEAASVFEAPFGSEIVGDIAALGESGGFAALDTLCRAGVLRQASDRSLEFAQPMLRDALYAGLSLPLRRHLHGLAFSALARRGLEAQAADHALKSDLSGDESAVEIVARVAAGALEDGSAVSAARHFRAAVELAGGRAGFELRLSLGEALLLSGRALAAGSVLQSLLRQGDMPTDPLAEARLLRALGHACVATGRVSSSAAHYAKAAELASGTAPTTAAAALLDLAIVSWQLAGVPAALLKVAEAKLISSSAGVSSRLASLDAYLRVLGGTHPVLPLGEDPAWAGIEDSRRRPDALAMPYGSAQLFAETAICLGELGEADRVLATTLAMARHAGSTLAAAQLMITRADVLLRLARLDEAATLATAAVKAADGAPGIGAAATAILAAVLLHQNRLDESREACTRAERGVRDGPDPVAALWIGHVRGQLHLQGGDPAGAVVHYAGLQRVAERLGVEEPCVVPWTAHAVAAHVESGDRAGGEVLLRHLERSAEHLRCGWPRVAAAWGRAALAQGDGDLASAETHHRAAVEAARSSGLELDRITSLLYLGRTLRRSGRQIEARGPLAEGLWRAEQARAELLATHLRDELSAAGGRRSRRSAPGTGLTPQETRIAALASQGRTNRQIAASLSLSINTVETHLQRVFAKLNIRSRVELVARRQVSKGDPAP